MKTLTPHACSRAIAITGLCIALVGCSSADSETEKLVPARPVGSIIADTLQGTVEGAFAAVQTPFEDINLKRDEIPEKLQQISANPYILPSKLKCDGLLKEIDELDTLLGPDVCPTQGKSAGEETAEVSKKGEYVEKGANAARDQAVSMVSSKTNIIPFRGAVRYISGADRHAKAVTQAYEAGRLRRAFLKGLAMSLGKTCVMPQEVEPLVADTKKDDEDAEDATEAESAEDSAEDNGEKTMAKSE